MTDEDLSELLRSMREASVSPPMRSSAQRDADLAAMLAAGGRSEGRTAGRVLVALASLVAALLLVGLSLRSRTEGALATVHGAGGGALLLRGAEARTIVGLATARAHAGDRIATLDAGSAVVTLDGALITVAARSELGVLAKGGATCELRGGRARFAVQKRSPGAPFVVRARDVEVLVHGTTFEVWIDAANAVHVHVDEGIVGVVAAGRAEARVGAGEDWPPSMAPGDPASSVTVLSPPPISEDRAAALPQRPMAASARVRQEVHEARRPHAPPEIVAQPAGSGPSAPALPVPPSSSGSVTAPSASSSDLSVQNELLRRAASARHAGDGDAERAALDELVRRFPGGVAVHDAVVARMRAAVAKGDRSSAEAEARRYLAIFPTGPLRAEASALLP